MKPRRLNRHQTLIAKDALPPLTDEIAASVNARHTHCTHCGAELIHLAEPGSLYDTTTGERKPEIWVQCPNYPTTSWQAMSLFRSTCHESFRYDMPLLSRSWR